MRDLIRQRIVDSLAWYPDGRQVLLQVCADLDAASTRKRETRALLEARGEYPNAILQLISLEPEPPADLPSGITWQPATAWLLSETHQES